MGVGRRSRGAGSREQGERNFSIPNPHSPEEERAHRSIGARGSEKLL
ncbi:hypothetical protein NSP_31850 [Nodularia spumigena CCY9414]|nr:hypothetical protein NSP_31850 [Nodularia spumigena CCY9414]